MALVIPDSTGFGSQVLVTLVTPTINQIINMIKESENNELFIFLNGSRMAQLLACWQAGLSIQSETVTNQTMDPINLNEAGKMTKKEEVDGFLSKIIHNQMTVSYLGCGVLLGNNTYVMTQCLKGGDGPHLPHDLSEVNTYTEVISGSK